MAVQNLITDDQAWCLVGDFNVCLNPQESSRGLHWTSGMIEFKDFVAQVGVTELHCVGPLHTWWDCNIHSPTQKRLDRCMVNGVWLSRFADSQASVLPRGISDHCPVAISMGWTRTRIKKPFAFYNHLIQFPEFLPAVREAWNSEIMGDPWFVLIAKLKKVKEAMRYLNSEKGNLHTAVVNARDSLFAFQASMPTHPTTAQYNEEKDLINKFQHALRLEEIMLKQKSRVHWLKTGDSNNRFFFNSCRGRWNCNKITTIEDGSGTVVTTHKEIAKVAIDYYSSMLGQSGEIDPIPDDLNLPCLSEVQKELLIKPFSATDIWQTFKHMAKNKSPGPDGFTAEFFVAAWSIVGEDVVNGVLHFFQSKHMPRIINSVAIALVPKQQPAHKMSEF